MSNNKQPTVVCLCGSTRFKDAFIKAQKDETLKGKIVLSVGLFGHEENIDMNGPVKKMLDELHLRKIDMADEVLILNVGDYIGQSTRRELEYALGQGKAVRFLEKPKSWFPPENTHPTEPVRELPRASTQDDDGTMSIVMVAAAAAAAM